jgi:NADH dehydrogenase/NADH:ubiquinone oxidoreductase subunit G
VGALKNRDFLYTARVWNLDEMPSVCGLCAKGCSIRVDSLKGEVKRVMARENKDVNGFWVCDRGRVETRFVNSPARLERPLGRQGAMGWDAALKQAAEALKKAGEDKAGAWGIVHASATNEELWLFRRLVKDTLGIENIAVLACPDVAPLAFPGFKAPADGNANRLGCQVLLGVKNAEESVARFNEAGARGDVRHVIMLSGLQREAREADEIITKAGLRDSLAREQLKNFVLLDFQKTALCEHAHCTLPTQTHFEQGGSFINADMRLQAFRAALPFPLKGRPATETLQDLLAALSPEAKAGTAKPRVIVGAAALFDEMAKSVPQFAAHSHLSLIRQKGAPLL